MTTDTPDDAVPVAEIEALIESWDQWIEDCDSGEATARMAPMKAQLEALCADVEGEE